LGQADDQLKEYVKEGLRLSRDMIRSGAFSAEGTHTVGGQTMKFKLFHAFDSQALVSRTDQEWFDLNGNPNLALGQCIKLRKKNILLSPGDTTISIVPISRPLPKWAECWDFRSLGLAFLGDVIRRKDFDYVWGNYLKLPITKAEDIGDGKYEVVWNSNRKFIIDESRGFWPIEFVKTSGQGQEQQKCSVELIELNGVWVPSIYKIVETTGDSTNSVAINFDWKSVNEELDKDLFDYSTFKASKGMKIVDFSIPGRPVTIEIVGKDVISEVGATESYFSRVNIFVGIASLTIGTIVVAMFFRRQNSN
jgi:hypothetical protein